MDCSTPTLRVEIYPADAQSTSRTLASPDTEARGRQRRRDPLTRFSMPRHHSTRESSTLRGRCRHRSASRMNLVALPHAAPSHCRRRGDSPEPGRRRLLVVVRPEGAARRRGRSPLRSRSPGPSREAEGLLASPVMLVAGQGSRTQRTQRTQSRNRRHGWEGAQHGDADEKD